jgi:hypothetical protein
MKKSNNVEELSGTVEVGDFPRKWNSCLMEVSGAVIHSDANSL